MRWRVILGISLMANLMLALILTRSTRSSAPATGQSHSATNVAATSNRTAVIVRRQFFSWQQLESQDYQAYIKNLREVGCPEQTIRDIIIADVTQMLREKYLAASPRSKPNPKWWTNHRDAAEDDWETQNASRMWGERGAILEQLLGPDWAVRGRTTPAPSNTNAPQNQILATIEVNPILQALPADKKQFIATLLSQSPSLGLNAETAFTGENWDPAKLIAAEKERWARLSEVLTLEQLEAAKLHFSIQAGDLRNELDALPGFNTQPDEFRTLFRNTENIEAQLAALANRDDEAAIKERATLNALRETAIRSSLSPERYELYARLSDPAYLEAMEAAGGKGDSTAIGLLYAINRERAAEQERIENDPTLTDAQREIELKRLELEQLKATAQALGEAMIDEPEQKQKPKPEPMKTHSVLAGEGLERIARIYGVPPEALRAANPNLDFNKLPAGANVNVPLRLIYPLPPPSE